MNDIFLSYRRKDAEAFAYILYKDLQKDGYSVFYDHKTLGRGDFFKNIETSIQQSADFVIILSASSFSSNAYDEKDVYRFEIETALKYKKNIIGIAIDSFSGFPEKLPASIECIRTINYIPCVICYYEAMYDKLTTGGFLTCSKNLAIEKPVTNCAIQSDVPKQLISLAELPISERNTSVQLLLQIMESFNNSEILLRFYNYIDNYDRIYNKNDMQPYSGTIPTDLVTYLSFFETLYIIIASKTIELSIIDFAYRFRFFAGCNISIMQESELLPLGYQYPNIVSLYNMWSEYIVSNYDHSQKTKSVSNEIPLYDNDLHKNIAIYRFSNQPDIPMRIRFLNRNLIWLNLTIKLIRNNEIDNCMSFQAQVLNNIPNNDTNNIFEPLTHKEMEKSLHKSVCVGLYNENDELTAQMNIIINPDESEDLSLDLDEKYQNKDICIIDYIVVNEKMWGYSIQKAFLFLADCIAKNHNKKGICAVISPHNTYSIKNFLSKGYSIIATKPKYKSTRHYFWKNLN